jgi:hypothetical protein
MADAGTPHRLQQGAHQPEGLSGRREDKEIQTDQAIRFKGGYVGLKRFDRQLIIFR